MCRYHKIPGDKCVGGFSPKGTRQIDMKKKCEEGDKSYLFEEEEKNNRPTAHSLVYHNKVGGHVILWLLLIILHEFY